MEHSLNSPNLPSGSALAFLGDAVFSLYIRNELVKSGISHSKNLNIFAQKYVTATAQAKFLSEIRDMLNDEEYGIYRRAANSNHLNRPKNVPAAVYRSATGLEALFGALYYTGHIDRMNELLSKLQIEVAYDDTEN